MTTKPIALSIAAGATLSMFAGCSTMKVSPLTTGDADSYTQHQQQHGLVVGVQPMTDKKEIEGVFKVNLLDHGLLPILVVAENQSSSENFIIAKEKVTVSSAVPGTPHLTQSGEVGAGASSAGSATGWAGAAMALASPALAAPLIIASAKLGSDATVVQYNLADKEFYSRTLGPGQKAQGFLYLQFPKASPPAGEYHVIAKVKDSATGEETAFDFPVNLTVSK